MGVELSWTVLEFLDGKGDDWVEELRDCLGELFVETNGSPGCSHFSMSERWGDAMMVQISQMKVLLDKETVEEGTEGGISARSQDGKVRPSSTTNQATASDQTTYAISP
jgi:hypothetical protein